MDVRTKKFIDDLNQNLNKLYTINFACLKAGARANQNNFSETGKFSGSTWLDDKMQILSNQRNNWIASIKNAVLDLDTCGFNKAMEQFKQEFMQTFEMIYGPSGSFEDNFDGFVIKHPKFKKDFFNLDILCKISNNHPRFNLLCYNYLSYLNYYKQQISYESYDGIFSALVGDLQSNGYRSFYFQRPGNDVALISKEEIEQMLEDSRSRLKSADIATAISKKKHLKYYKKTQSPKATEEAKERFAHFRACFEHEENQQAFADELHNLTKIFAKRLESANTPSNTTLANTLYENFYDLMSGVNIFDEKNNYQTDKVYVHKREFEYYNYLLSQLETMKKYEVKENESLITQKQQ